MVRILHQESVEGMFGFAEKKGWCIMEWNSIFKIVKKIARAVESVIDIFED